MKNELKQRDSCDLNTVREST